MEQSMGMRDFFTMEAGDYLERLDVLVSAAKSPEATDFVRLSRALRGSAIMAGQDKIATVAAGLESLSRAMADRRMTWDEASRQLAIRAVDDLKVLVRAVTTWSDAEDARAQQIATELERFAGRTTVARRMEAPKLDAGTRAFIAREGAAVGNALDQAARSLAAHPDSVEPLQSVLRAMQPLRGIASLSDLPPLPDLFEGIDRAIHEVRKRQPPPSDSAKLFDAAARAVSAAAREIAAGGQADPDSAAAQEFVAGLSQLFDVETEVVPIERLYHDDHGPHVVSEGRVPGGADLGKLELVSHLEYLKQAADDIERATSSTQRELRAQALTPTFRALAMAAGGPLASAAASFARAARDAIARGAASLDPRGFAATLREASSSLSEAAQSEESQPTNRLTQVIAGLSQLATETTSSAAITEPARPAVKAPTVASATTAAREPSHSGEIPAYALPPDGPLDLAAGMHTYHELVYGKESPEDADETSPDEFGSTEEVAEVALPADALDPGSAFITPADETESAEEEPSRAEVYSSALAGLPQIDADESDEASHDDDVDFLEPADSRSMPEPPVLTDAPVRQDYSTVVDAEEMTLDDVVPITEYCYSGPAALERAISLRSEVRAAMASGTDQENLTELLEEIFDLVQLGIQKPV
jgi:chemotaxis protein histidine kinase CheA